MAVDHAIISSRILTYSREAVFSAISNPAALAAWWGPAGFTNEFHEFDFRPGGVWRFTMRAPDGAAYAMDHRFTEIVAPEQIVVRHLQPGHDFTLTVTLTSRGERTEVGWHMVFDDPAEAARVLGFVLPANEQNLDRLQRYLAKNVSGAR